MTIAEKSLALHYNKKGKIRVESTVPVKNSEDLSLAYTPVLLRLVWKFKRTCPNPMN